MVGVKSEINYPTSFVNFTVIQITAIPRMGIYFAKCLTSSVSLDYQIKMRMNKSLEKTPVNMRITTKMEATNVSPVICKCAQ